MIEERGGWFVVKGAEVPEPTDQIPVAYADVAPRTKLDQPEWPLD